MFKWFCSFKALVENQIGKKIKILRTDNGTQYESNEFKDHCREAGINRETTTAYTLEQNGVAERMNRTIIEATPAMLHDQCLPKFLWGEAANTIVYVQNKCPHQALDFKTLEEVFIGKKPNVFAFRIFGCPVYFHVPKEKRNKLDAFGKKGTFLGYIETSKAYRIYLPDQREVELSHDVTFDEDFALGKVRDLPIPKKGNGDDVGKLDDSPSDEPKALYGLKQAPRAWYDRIDSYHMTLGFTKSNANPNLYFKVKKDRALILVLYVDDLFLTSDDTLIHQCKREWLSSSR